MIWGVSALAWALAMYLYATRNILPLRTWRDALRDKTRRIKKSSPAWSVTKRAMRLLGWSPARFRLLSLISAGLLGVFWLLVVQDLLAAAIMAYIGWQLPALWLEIRATRDMGDLHRQFSEFVTLIYDQLYSRGATVDTALTQSATEFTTGPIAPMMAAYLRMAGGGAPLHERLAGLRQAIDLPTADFFFQLLMLRDQSGAEDMSHAFNALDEKLQDDEHLQTTIRGEIRMHSFFLIAGFLANFVAFPLFRFTNTDWAAIHAHLQIVVTGSAVVTVIVFWGIRRFTKAQLQIGAVV